jgi:tRNA dimethylallyltransferase
VGKTGLAVRVAQPLDTEILSADSMQIYRHMDIGTAKPSSEELKRVKHHMINILSPYESFSAGIFKNMALGIIESLHERNKVPVVVGGTGLYIRTLSKGLFEGPEADWTVRERLLAEETRHGKGYLHKQLGIIDPESAGKINPNDRRRVIRALEVSIKSERTMSQAHRQSTETGKFSFIKIGLTRARKELYEIIEQRVDTMITGGLLRETEQLLRMDPCRNPLQALGYKEMKLFLDGSLDFEDAVRLLKKRTKMFAKRQYTWFRKEPGVQWVDLTGINDKNKIFEKVLREVEILRELIYGKTSSKKKDL